MSEIPPPPPQEEPDDCDACHGSGIIIDTSEDTDISPMVECPVCKGTGKC